MSRIQFEIPNEVAAEVERRAERRGVSADHFVAELVCREVAAKRVSGWPEGFFERVIGQWQGDLERPEELPLESRAEF